MYKEALMLVAKLAFKTHIKYPVLFSAAIFAATYMFLYKTAPREPPSTPSVDLIEMGHVVDEDIDEICDNADSEQSIECESLGSEPSASKSCDVISTIDTDSSWTDESRENDFQMARRAFNTL